MTFEHTQAVNWARNRLVQISNGEHEDCYLQCVIQTLRLREGGMKGGEGEDAHRATFF
jgi:hypothetical protein